MQSIQRSWRMGISAITAICGCLAAGCQGQRIAGQGIAFREALLGMYEDQLWDSLIRAKRNQPFVLLEYTELFAQDVEELGTDGGYSETVTSTSSSTFGAASMTLGSRVVAPTWKVNASAKRAGTVNFKAKPVSNGGVIEAIVQFARERLQASCNPPQECHDYRLRDGVYYSVAKADAPSFLNLALRSSFPIDDAAAARGFYRTTIVAVTAEPMADPQSPARVYRLTLGDPVPNGGATIDTPFGAYEARAVEQRALGGKTRELLVTWKPEYQPRDPTLLKDVLVRVFSADYPPVTPSPEQQTVDQIQKLINSVDRMSADRLQMRAP